MSKPPTFVLIDALAHTGRRHDQNTDLPPPSLPPSTDKTEAKTGWATAALLRGYYTSRQTAVSTKLALAGVIHATAYDGHERLAQDMAKWERKIQECAAIVPKAGRLKSLIGGLLFMAGYVGPVIALGTAATAGIGMVATGGWAAAAAIACTCAINTHQAAGEAFLQTTRSRDDIKLHDGATLATALHDQQFQRVVRGNVILKSGISLAFTAVAGPVARLFGGFTNDILRVLLTHTPLDRVIGRELARSIEQSVLKSTSVKVGRWLANMSIRNGKGYEPIANAFNSAAAVVRAASALILGGVQAVPPEPKKDIKAEIMVAAPATAKFAAAVLPAELMDLRAPPAVICAQACPRPQPHI